MSSSISQTVPKFWILVKTPNHYKCKYFIARNAEFIVSRTNFLDGPGIQTPWGARFSSHIHTYHGAQPSSCTMGTGSFHRLKRPGLGLDHPPHLLPMLKKE